MYKLILKYKTVFSVSSLSPLWILVLLSSTLRDEKNLHKETQSTIEGHRNN